MHLGIDVGGSHIGFAILDENFNIAKQYYVEINKENTEQEIFKIIKDKVLENMQYNISDIGIAIPGICDIKNKKIVNISNLNIHNSDLIIELEKELNIPIFLDNDIKCATICECIKGNMKEYANGVFLGVGTGIGGAIVLNGEIHRGTNFTAGEIGHMVILKDGIECGCGNKGCFEKYASLSALRKLYKIYDNNLNDEEFWKYKDTKYIKVYNEWLDYLAIGIANLYNILDMDVVIIGGGLSEYFEYIKDDLVNKVKEKVYNKSKDINIQKALYDNNSGIIGAGMLAKII